MRAALHHTRVRMALYLPHQIQGPTTVDQIRCVLMAQLLQSKVRCTSRLPRPVPCPEHLRVWLAGLAFDDQVLVIYL
mgnify:FL=1